MTGSPRKNRRRMEIERDGTRVRFVVHCADEYDAMALYDEAVAGAEAGHLDLTIVARSAAFKGERDGG